ncbi:DUF4192 domain-containing protein [Streptomyces sp. NPDC008313]|uniref:DUF4192 domain-containing protein n=1 Tax=Streptomyces sp. NPDC008313 TaxID=3364826 RepID=UPI0036E52CE2
MTNHSEMADPSGSGDISGIDGRADAPGTADAGRCRLPAPRTGDTGLGGLADGGQPDGGRFDDPQSDGGRHDGGLRDGGRRDGGRLGGGERPSAGGETGGDPARGTGDHAPGTGDADSCGHHQVTLRTPGELADALPYLLGYRPEDSIVLAALHDGQRRGRFGGRARLGIPAQSDDWPAVAEQLARGLVTGSERRGARPGSMVAFLCQEPASGESGRDVMRRLRPLAQLLRTACGRLDVPVVEALCISDGRFWSYCCPGQGCCSADGQPMGLPGTSVLAAAATYAGLRVRGSLRELTARLTPWESAAALAQEVALDTANMALVPRILEAGSRAEVAGETLGLAHRIMGRLADAPPEPDPLRADRRDDGLIGHDEAATVILGLQDRTTRDRAAEWMEGDEAGPALRLWRALARRCVGPYREHAAAPLTLAGWVAWSSGDELEAREALAMAIGVDPDYLFARLLHQACNEGLDPESVRRCLRAERTGRGAAAGSASEPVEGAGPSSPTEKVPVAPGTGVPPELPPAPRTGRRRSRTHPAGSARGCGDRRPPGRAGAHRRGGRERGPGRAPEDTSGRFRLPRTGGKRTEEDT